MAFRQLFSQPVGAQPDDDVFAQAEGFPQDFFMALVEDVEGSA
jgi:hypothetical protein